MRLGLDPLLKQILDPEGAAALTRALKAPPGAKSNAQIAALVEHQRALAGEVIRLRAALAVVVEALQRGGGIDAPRALARMRELTVLGDEPTAVAPPPAMTPPRGGAGGSSHGSDLVFECQRCKKVVAATASYVTSQGTFCAACYAEAPP